MTARFDIITFTTFAFILSSCAQESELDAQRARPALLQSDMRLKRGVYRDSRGLFATPESAPNILVQSSRPLRISKRVAGASSLRVAPTSIPVAREGTSSRLTFSSANTPRVGDELVLHDGGFTHLVPIRYSEVECPSATNHHENLGSAFEELAPCMEQSTLESANANVSPCQRIADYMQQLSGISITRSANTLSLSQLTSRRLEELEVFASENSRDSEGSEVLFTAKTLRAGTSIQFSEGELDTKHLVFVVVPSNELPVGKYQARDITAFCNENSYSPPRSNTTLYGSLNHRNLELARLYAGYGDDDLIPIPRAEVIVQPEEWIKVWPFPGFWVPIPFSQKNTHADAEGHFNINLGIKGDRINAYYRLYSDSIELRNGLILPAALGEIDNFLSDTLSAIAPGLDPNTQTIPGMHHEEVSSSRDFGALDLSANSDGSDSTRLAYYSFLHDLINALGETTFPLDHIEAYYPVNFPPNGFAHPVFKTIFLTNGTRFKAPLASHEVYHLTQYSHQEGAAALTPWLDAMFNVSQSESLDEYLSGLGGLDFATSSCNEPPKIAFLESMAYTFEDYFTSIATSTDVVERLSPPIAGCLEIPDFEDHDDFQSWLGACSRHDICIGRMIDTLRFGPENFFPTISYSKYQNPYPIGFSIPPRHLPLDRYLDIDGSLSYNDFSLGTDNIAGYSLYTSQYSSISGQNPKAGFMPRQCILDSTWQSFDDSQLVEEQFALLLNGASAQDVGNDWDQSGPHNNALKFMQSLISQEDFMRRAVAAHSRADYDYLDRCNEDLNLDAGCSNGVAILNRSHLNYIGESDIDCGGLLCDACAQGQGCMVDTDCAGYSPSGNITCAKNDDANISDIGVCTTYDQALCVNGIQDPGEIDVDCGGSCPTCENGAQCRRDTECTSGTCARGIAEVTLTSGDAHFLNLKRELYGTCVDAESLCTTQPTQWVAPPDFTIASDGLRAEEFPAGSLMKTGASCGGSCHPCALDAPCLSQNDCMSGLQCSVMNGVLPGICTAAENYCNDDIPNTEVNEHGGVLAINYGYRVLSLSHIDRGDCGDHCPQQCQALEACVEDSDCDSGSCVLSQDLEGVLDEALDKGKVCVPGTCFDQIPNGSESDVDCGGASCPRCTKGRLCNIDSDCLSDHCIEHMNPKTGIERRCYTSCFNGVQDGTETGTDCGGLCTACTIDATL